MTRIRNRNGFCFIFTLLICIVCFDVTIQRQISQGYPGSSYSTVGHDGTLNGQLTDVQKHILDNGGRTVAHDGRPENIQPLRAGGEDPLRLRLVFMAEVNQTTQSDRPNRQEVHSLASHPSSMNLRVSNQYSPHGDIVRLDSQGILVAQKRRNQAPIPQRTSSNDAGRISNFRTGSVVPSPPARRDPPTAEARRDPPTAEARRYKEEAPIQRPVVRPFRSRNMFKPLSAQSPGFTPLERLTDRVRPVNTNPDPPWRPERQRDPSTQPRDRVNIAARNTGDPYRQQQSDPNPSRNSGGPYRQQQSDHNPPRNTGDPYRQQQNEPNPPRNTGDPYRQPQSDPNPSRNSGDPYRQQQSDPYPPRNTGDPYRQQQNEPNPSRNSGDPYRQQQNEPNPSRNSGDPYRQQQNDPYPPRNTGDPYRQQQSEPYPSHNTRYPARPNVNEGTQARRLGNILSNMGHTRHDPVPLPSSHADSRPYPIQYTLPDSATEMRVRRIKQPEASRAQPRYVDHAADRVRVRPEPTTHFQDARQPTNNNAGSGVAIPDTYSNRVRAPPQTPRDSGRFGNEQPQRQLPQTEIRVPSASSAQIPRQPYQQPTIGQNPNDQSPTNATGEMVVLSMQENADGTITYTVADRRKANVNRMNNVPVQVKKPTAAYSNSNGYDQPQQQHQSYRPYNVDSPNYQSGIGANTQNPTEPANPGASYYSAYGQHAPSNQTFINEAPRTLGTATQYDPYQRSAASDPYSYQQASQTQGQQNQGFDPQRYDTLGPHESAPQAAHTQRYDRMSAIPQYDYRTQFHSGAAKSSANTEMPISSVAGEPVTYIHSVTSPTSEVSNSVSSTEATKPMHGNYTIDDGVVYPIPKGNNSVPVDVNHAPTVKTNTTNPFTPRQEPAVHNPGEIRVEPSRPGNPRSYVLRENGGYAFRGGSVPTNSNSGSVGQYPVASSHGSQQSPVGVSFQETTPSSQPRSNLQVLKDIVKISGGKRIPSQVLGGRSNTARSSSVTQQRAVSPTRASSGHMLVEAAKGLTKLQALKALECIPVTVSNTAHCQSSCLPFQNCVTAGSILFCCPPFVTETVVQFNMVKRTMEGMSDSL